MNKKIVVFGFSLLFFSSYLDNVRGPLLPVLTKLLGLGYQESSVLLISGSLGAVFFTLLLIPFLNRVSNRTALYSVFLLASLAVASTYFVHNLLTLASFAFLLGATVAVFGSMANLLTIKGTTPESRASVFCLLHMMYGLGSLMGPTVSGLLLTEGALWMKPLLAAIPVLVLGFLLTPWIFKEDVKEAKQATESTALGGFEIFVLLLFALYVAGEVMLSMWLSTYLVEQMHFTLQESAPYLGAFFIVMSVTRAMMFFGMGRAKSRSRENVLLVGCLLVSVFCFVLGLMGYVWAFPLSGLLGPFFPLFLARMSMVFAKKARVMTLWALGSNNLVLMLCHLGIGTMADQWGIRVAYLLPGLLLVSSILLLFPYFALEKKMEGKHA